VLLERINIREKKQQKIQNQLQNMCFQDPELKYLGQKAFVSYTRSLYVQKDKEIFKINEYDLEGYAASMGLPGAPKIKFQKGDDAKKLKNAPRAALSSGEDSDEEEKKPKKEEEVRTKYDRMFERRNQDVLSGHYSKMIAEDEVDGSTSHVDADEDNDFLSVKRVVPVDGDSSSEEDVDEDKTAASGPAAKVLPGIGREPIVIDSKRREKLLRSKKKLLKLKEKGHKVLFDDEGVPYEPSIVKNEEDFKKQGSAEAQRAKFLEEEASRVREADIEDKKLAKEKKREKREKRKAREATQREGIDEQAPDLAEAGEDEDPMALLRSLPLPEDEEEQERPTKKPKKWFEDDSDDERKVAKKRSRVIEAADEPETLEDLEALATGLLN
jgi:ATP-dependent RNA helicase DDX10/DBP4